MTIPESVVESISLSIDVAMTRQYAGLAGSRHEDERWNELCVCASRAWQAAADGYLDAVRVHMQRAAELERELDGEAK